MVIDEGAIEFLHLKTVKTAENVTFFTHKTNCSIKRWNECVRAIQARTVDEFFCWKFMQHLLELLLNMMQQLFHDTIDVKTS